jgi:hypothetical protein
MIHRIALLGAAIACAATAAPAQELVFSQIPWGAPADSVRARLEARGYEYRGIVGSGDRAFVRPDDAFVTVAMRADRAVGFVSVEPPVVAVEARFQAVADSLEARFGTPLDRRPELRRWERGLTSATVQVAPDPDGVRRVQTEWRGPGWYDEMGRRGALLSLPALPAGYTTVSMTGASRISVDTATLTRREGRPLRARFRIDYAQPLSDDGDRYDAIEYGMDFDCSGGRTRLVSRTTFLGGRRQRSDSSEGLPWSAARAGSDPSRGMDAVCRVAGRGPAVVAQPARTRTFGPPPAGWVVMVEGETDRWLLDPASVRAKGAGIHAATVRVENGAPQDSPVGRMDTVVMQFEVDCTGTRARITRVTGMLRGRDLGALPLPPSQSAWRTPPEGHPVLPAVCGLVAERRP